MINIGEISKPSVSESPVRPKRSTSDGMAVTPTEGVERPSKVSSPIKKKSREDKKPSETEISADSEQSEAELLQDEQLEDEQSNDNQLHDEDLYDKSGHQEHHGDIDLKA